MKPIDTQTILITGATDGIGKGAAADLAAAGARVLLHGRSDDKLAALRDEISRATGNDRLETYRADFASLDAVRELAGSVSARHDRLDVLLSNAGLGKGRENRRETSRDGHELRFQINYLAPFLLQALLLPRRQDPHHQGYIGERRRDADVSRQQVRLHDLSTQAAVLPQGPCPQGSTLDLRGCPRHGPGHRRN